MNLSWWPSDVELTSPWWGDYRSILASMPEGHFPNCSDLNKLLPNGFSNEAGRAIRFVASSELSTEDYENRIFTSGRISTRPQSWHDLFNATVWLRFPQVKIAMNALHHRAEPQAIGRGKLRDALTLFDECGCLVVSSHEGILEAIGKRSWSQVFQLSEHSWNEDVKAFIFGHAMLEKLISPYKSMTAKALLVQVSRQAILLPRHKLIGLLDKKISRQLLQGKILTKPAHLTPLPLAGIPGWNFAGDQNENFYADNDVFRPAAAILEPANIIKLDI